MARAFDSLPTWILSAAATRSHHALHRRLAAAGYSGYEFRCLTVLAGTDHLSQTQLGDAAALDPRDVTQTVRTLEARGLVARDRDPSHGRRILVSLTHTGRLAAETLVPVMDAVQDDVFGRLSADERSALLELLQRVG
ncbi:MarR family winged helix-turn-helix transcriptional regulator [Homoserinibacter sp. GY 40078]|uniref:MarR family winged helix-turn-helix transcriptional regulator n=1 Tax=Homoserinibacter sp. GY 40078 TaxID=2603275 RepID=UPI0011CB2AE6|nr:MarR family transcriptional regulator [Homoserinibacter sp. GY 40078]TXK19639.1 MarR family transcriptional regulator [Homoserinibacter sp. GY 40078]